MKFKKGMILLSLFFISMLIHASSAEPVAAATVDIQNASYYSGSSLSNQIQAVINSASSGDTINFLGQVYENLQITITKKLNIVTSAGTSLIGNSSILISGSQASGTQITGFNITGQGITVNNTRNVTLADDQVSSAGGTAVTLNRSTNTTIKNSSISNSDTGINISNSKNTHITGSTISNNAKIGVGIYNSSNTTINSSTLAGNGNNSSAETSIEGGAVYIQNSDNVRINGNQIKDNMQGVSTNGVSNVTVSNNTIKDNYGAGVSLSGSAQNLTINSNDIERNGNGLKINYNSCKNINISGNLITGSAERITMQESGNGVLYGSSYSRSTTESIQHNVIYGNSHFETRACTAPVSPLFGSNWFGDSQWLCPAIDYGAPMKMVMVKTGQNTYKVVFYDGITNTVATDLWSIPVTFTAGNFSQTVMTQNGVATIQVDAVPLTNALNAAVGGITVSKAWDSPIDDYTAPTVTAKPVYSAPQKNIKVTFSEPVQTGNGWIELKDSTGKNVSSTTSISGDVLTITPTSTLANGAIYTLILHTGSITDLAGNNLSVYSSTFTADSTAPVIKTVDPANKATNVATGKVIKVTFSETVKAGNNYIELKYSKGKVIAINKSLNGNTLTITPTTALAKGMKYTLIIHSGSMVDASGNSVALYTSTFTTDSTAPKVKTINPASKTTNVVTSKTINVTFSEAIKAGNNYIELKNSKGKAVAFTKSISGNVLTITPTTALAKGTKYTLIIHTGSVVDASGNSVALYTSIFTTDGTAPKVKGVSPANNAVNVPNTAVAMVTFTENIKEGTYWIELKGSNGKSVSVAELISSNALLIIPESTLTKGVKYTLTLHTGCVTDLSGNSLSAYKTTFTVKK